MSKLRVTAVNYLNTKPLLYGLVKSGMTKKIDLQLDIPSECARKLESGEVDFGLVPAAVIPSLSSPYIISDFCIGTVGTVATVCIYSDVPLEKVEKIYLDFHSRTSVQLTKILIKNFWKLPIEFIQATPGYIEKIGGTTAGLIIGDRAMEFGKNFKYEYDLGEAWLDYTGLPFSFANWVSNKPLPEDFILEFNAALKSGIDFIPDLLYIIPPPSNGFNLERYFTENISYDFNFEKKKALHRFLEEMEVEIQPSVEMSLSL